MPWGQGPGVARYPQETLPALQLWPHGPTLRWTNSCSQWDLAREGLRAWTRPLTSLAEEVKMHFANHCIDPGALLAPGDQSIFPSAPQTTLLGWDLSCDTHILVGTLSHLILLVLLLHFCLQPIRPGI